jgi:hypothetical protein
VKSAMTTENNFLCDFSTLKCQKLSTSGSFPLRGNFVVNIIIGATCDENLEISVKIWLLHNLREPRDRKVAQFATILWKVRCNIDFFMESLFLMLLSIADEARQTKIAAFE